MHEEKKMAVKGKIYLGGLCSIILLSFLTLAWGASPEGPSITSARIGKKDLTGTIELTVIKDDLTRERNILIVGLAEGGGPRVEKVEVSLNGGQTWKEATGRERWQYEFPPLPNYTYFLTLRVTNADGVVSNPKEFGITRFTYLPITLSELIQQRADELARAYMSNNLERYMGFISRDYKNYPSGWYRLRRAIENDFRSLNNIILRFSVNQIFELEGVIMADIHWKLTYAGLLEPKEGYVEIHFDPEDQLKILVQKKDLYFGAAVIGHDGRIQITTAPPGPGPTQYIFTVTDLDKVGANRVSVRVIAISGGGVILNVPLSLIENPRSSGRFERSRVVPIGSGDSVTATYIDEITSDWRRNVRRTDTLTLP
jgi:hypothetical protein